MVQEPWSSTSGSIGVAHVPGFLLGELAIALALGPPNSEDIKELTTWKLVATNFHEGFYL